MTNKKLADIIGGIAMAFMVLVFLSAVAMGGPKIGGPKIGDQVAVQLLCDTPGIIKTILTAENETKAYELLEQAQMTGQCMVIPPITMNITKVYPPFIDPAGDQIIIVQVEGKLYTFGLEKTTET